MAIVKNLTITDSGYLTLPSGSTAQRQGLTRVVQSFTSVGSTTWTAPTGVSSIEVLVVAGGGSGGTGGGGGGAGGLIYKTAYPVTPGTSYAVTVGAGGTSVSGWGQAGVNGGNSVFGTLTASGGGGGGHRYYSTGPANSQLAGSGGSGGGTAGGDYAANTVGYLSGGLGTQGQGYSGGRCWQAGTTAEEPGSGGGGAGGAGGDSWTVDSSAASAQSGFPGAGGPGLLINITGTPTYYAAGGGGSNRNGTGARGGSGIGGNGGSSPTAGADNTGSGGGGTGYSGYGGGGTSAVGGSGIVIIAYNQTSASKDPVGLIRYNTDLNDVEVYEDHNKKWVSQDPEKNFAGHNFFLYSTTLSNGVWQVANASISTSSATTAPNSATSTDVYKFVPTAGVAGNYILQDTSQVGGRRYCHSAYFKAAEYTFAHISPSTNFGLNNSWVNFDLINGTYLINGANTVGTTAGMTNEGNGWWRCWISTPADTTTSGRAGFGANASLSSGRLGEGLTGNGSSGIYIYGLQIEENLSTPGPFVKTLSANSTAPGYINGYRIHTYTSTGTSGFTPAVSGTVEVLVVAGGGSGGGRSGGGGGGGGVIYNKNYAVTSGQNYTVTVGAGAPATSGTGEDGSNGGNSVFGTLVAVGGGGGGSDSASQGRPGGSGGGGKYGLNGGMGIVGQGYAGGYGTSGDWKAGGGGGAGGPGADGQSSTLKCGDGGPGIMSMITGSPTWYGGGGGGGSHDPSNGVSSQSAGGIGGGGAGGVPGSSSNGTNGTANTGGGGGGGSTISGSGGGGGAGGSGIVIVRYKYN